jgi:hypothetical protein
MLPFAPERILVRRNSVLHEVWCLIVLELFLYWITGIMWWDSHKAAKQQDAERDRTWVLPILLLIILFALVIGALIWLTMRTGS